MLALLCDATWAAQRHVGIATAGALSLRIWQHDIHLGTLIRFHQISDRCGTTRHAVIENGNDVFFVFCSHFHPARLNLFPKRSDMALVFLHYGLHVVNFA